MKALRGGICCVALLFLVVATMVAQDTGKDPLSNTDIASAQSVGREVQRALSLANDTGLSGLHIRKAILNLETGSTKSGGVELNFIIFTISHTAKKSATQNTELVFAISRPAAGKSTGPETLSEPLAKAIAMAAQTASQVTVLQLSEATISLEFVVDKDTSGKLSFKVLGATVGGNIDLDKTSKNSLKVTFD